MKMTSKATSAFVATAVLALGISALPTPGIFTDNQVGAVEVQASSTLYQTTTQLNLRTGDSINHKVVATVPKGEAVQYLGKKGTWFKVKYGKQTGYASSKYLVKKSSAKAPVKLPLKLAEPKPVKAYKTTESLNLRSGASTSYPVVTKIPKDKSVVYLEGAGMWFKVKFAGKTGYVNSAYLKKEGLATPPEKAKVYPAPSTKTPGKYVGGVLLVNKKNALPASYNPGVSGVAQKAVNAMVIDAKRQGVSLSTISAYRTHAYQTGLYTSYVEKHGKLAADRFSARPGYSEHQTGLAFDFGGTSKADWLKESFETTKEGKWLNANAHKYGFHLRYQKGKESITGYMYEPWHYRYLGSELAIKVKESGKTLEEYLDYVGK